MARGTLACRVPIPEDDRALTVWVRTARIQPLLWMLPGLLGLLLARRARTRVPRGA